MAHSGRAAPALARLPEVDPAIAALALLGIRRGHLWLFPMVQALASGIIGLVVSFALFSGAAALAETLFETGLTEAGGLVVLTFPQAAITCAAVLGFVALTAYFAALSAAAVDPADVLREGAT